MIIGYDLYIIDKEYLYSLFEYIKLKHIQLIHLKKKDDGYCFYIPTYQRLLFQFEYCQYIETIGLFKYILVILNHYLNIVGVVSFIISIIVSSYFIYDIKIIGTIPSLNQDILVQLKKENITLLTPLKSYETLNELLLQFKEHYKQQVEYMNIYQVGSVFHIEYTKRKQESLKKDDFRNIYASKDGMIASFDVDSGLIMVKQNDFVKKGDLLVSNTIISTQNETQIIPVEGSVYAYTFNSYEASVKDLGQDEAEVFYQLLLSIRSRIPTGAIIDKENVLQMTHTRSKIILKMHYTLIEDIAVKGEANEGNH